MSNVFSFVDQDRHRADYPPELTVILQVFGDPSQGYGGRHYDVIVDVQYANEDIRMRQVPQLDYGRGDLRYRDGEPFVLAVLGPEAAESQAKSVADIWRSSDYMESFCQVFGEHAGDLVEELIPIVRDTLELDCEIAQFTVRYSDPVDYYRNFFRLCRLIAEEDNAVFDSTGKLDEWRLFWLKGLDVVGQRQWYAEHGPEHGETQAQYDSVVGAFEALVADNLAALDRFERELVVRNT